jgi:hypothetical protein
MKRTTKTKTAIRGGMKKPRMTAGMSGNNFFTDIYDKVIKPVGGFLKRTKLISTVDNALGSVGVPVVGNIAKVADSVGLGRKRKGRRGAMRGSGAVRF